VLALLPPWVLLYLVSGKEGMKGGWPLAVVGSLGYIAGQYPVAVHLGPYLPDVTGAIVCFLALFALLKFWQPKTVLGYGGVPVDANVIKQGQGHGLKPGEVLQSWMPFIVLLIVVAAWTGPWSPLPKISWFKAQAVACSSLAAACDVAKPGVTAVFNFAPFTGGTAILASWIVVAGLLLSMGKLKAAQIGEVFRRTFHQMWGACLVGFFIFGLAYVFNYRHGGFARERLFEFGHRFHHCLPGTGLHRRRAVGVEYIDQCHVRQISGARRRPARHAAAAAADA